jgi:nitric oxide reductase activation protein
VRSEEVAGVQVFSNSKIEKDKEVKILARMREGLSDTRFRSIEMPPEDYHEYLRAKDIVGGSSRRLLNNIMQASNLEFEDIRKKYGVLDLSDAVQVVASKSDRSDVFLRDELMKQSFALVVLIDVSRSMGTAERENRARAICVADAMATFVTENTSCAIYAFSDRLYVLKDGSEAFSKSVRARIGGVPFEGTTYMPDALKAAAEFLKSKAEEQRIILVISDGYPYGYEGIYEALEENTLAYMGGGMILIGIGVDTERMGEYFKYSAGVYSQKDLINNVSRIFLRASMSELG